MKLVCNNCRTDLTKSLFTTKFKPTPKMDYFRQYEPPIGGVVNFEAWYNNFMWVINPLTLLDQSLLPVYVESSEGCCNYSWKRVNCSCEAILGYLNLDCWQSHKGLYLFKISVSRINI